ncbi:MAG: recombinase family protein [Acidobacteriaceae bacterium]
MEKASTAPPNPDLLSRAAQYVRMSTEHQQYSPENQLDVIRQYAAAHNMEVVRDTLIGWTPDRDFVYVEINRRLRRKHADLIASILDQLLELGATVSVNEDDDLLTINGEYTASLILARCRETRAGSHRWQLRFDESLCPDVVIAARLQPGNDEILDYYLLPRLDILTERLSLRPENGLILDVYRFNNLNFFMEMAHRARLEGAA